MIRSDMNLELVSKGVIEMAALVRSGKVSPVDLLEAHLAQIEICNPKINAFVSIDQEAALAAAKRAEQVQVQNESELGALHGVPVSIKSSIEVAGLRCESGTRLREGHVPEADAALVSRLRAAGAIVLGTTNVPELLQAVETDNLLYGRTSNPWDLTRTCGGSSGGEAAAIASYCSPGGVGSDAGASIRLPAHFCGITGLCPTPGRVPSTGHFPEIAGHLSIPFSLGPLARSVTDVKYMFEVLAGFDAADSRSVPFPGHSIDTKLLAGRRIGYFEDDGLSPVTRETRDAVREAAHTLERAGFEVEPFRPSGVERARELWWTFVGRAGGRSINEWAGDRVDLLSPLLQEFISMSINEPLSIEQFLRDWAERDRLRAQFLEETKDYAALLCPTTAIPAFRHGERSWTIDGIEVSYLEVLIFTMWFSILNMPALSLPVGRSGHLPIGIQLVGRPFEDELLLEIGGHIEMERGGWLPPPGFEL